MNDEPEPPGLGDFGRRLDEVARHDFQEELRRRRGGHVSRPRAWPAVIATVVLAGGVAVGATAVFNESGSPIEREPRGGDLTPPVDPSVVAATRTPDPGGGVPWVLRVFTNARGQECLVLGRLNRGRFGQVQGGRFRPLPPASPGLCDSARSELLAFLDRRPDPRRTIVYGLTKGTAEVSIRLGRETRRVSPVALGAYLLVVASAERSVTVTTTVAGSSVTRRIG